MFIKKYVSKLIILFAIFTIIYLEVTNNIENFSDITMKYYEELMENYRNIFPNMNRNAGGPQYFKYIIEMEDMNHEKFKIMNQFYCVVSGSPIDPERRYKSDPIVLPTHDGYVYGTYYRCCSPCLCDLIRDGNVIVEKYSITFDNQEEEYSVLTIKEPCEKEIPPEVSSFNCIDNQTQNGIHTNTNRLIIGLLHNTEVYDENNENMKQVYDALHRNCKERNNTSVEDLKYGMGDIFVKISE